MEVLLICGKNTVAVLPARYVSRQAIYKSMIKLALESGLNVPESVATSLSLKENQPDVKTTV